MGKYQAAAEATSSDLEPLHRYLAAAVLDKWREDMGAPLRHSIEVLIPGTVAHDVGLGSGAVSAHGIPTELVVGNSRELAALLADLAELEAGDWRARAHAAIDAEPPEPAEPVDLEPLRASVDRLSETLRTLQPRKDRI